MKMTKVDALNVALSALTADSYDVQYDAVFGDGTPTIHTETYTQQEVREVIEKMIAQLSKPRSDEAKAKASVKRKEANAKARAELIAQVAPILRKYLSADYRQKFEDEDARKKFGFTAKELFLAAAPELPEGFTAPKVQNILIREMAPELVRTERKKGGDLYRLAD